MKKYDNYKDSGIEWIGEIPEHWEIILFKRAINKIKDGTHGSFQRISMGYPFLSAKNVYDNGVRIGEVESYISEEDYLEITKNGFPKKNDLLITCVGTIGRTFVYQFEESMAFQRSVTFIRFKDGINPQFYKYYVQSSIYQNLLLSLAKTSAQSGVYMNDLMNSITIKLPPKEQTAIANYLDHKTTQIDHLITQKEQLIVLLQEERTAVINQAVTKGLDSTVKMKDSGIEWLGEIPEHWEVKRMNFISTKIGDGLHGTPNYVEQSTFPFINGNNIGEGEIIITDRTKFVSEEDYYINQKTLTLNTLLMSINGTIGNLAHYNGETIMLGKSAAYINLKENVNKEFIYFYLKSEIAMDYINMELSGSTIKNLSLYSINKTPIPYPPSKEQDKIVDYIKTKTDDLDAIISKAKQEIELLKEYKTALISEVVTGKVDVREAVLN